MPCLYSATATLSADSCRSLLVAGLVNRLPIRLSYAKYTATYCGSAYRYRAYLSGAHIAAAHLSMSLREKCGPKSSRFEVAVRNVSIPMHKCVLAGHDLLQVFPHNKYCVQSRRRKDAVRSSVGVATMCRHRYAGPGTTEVKKAHSGDARKMKFEWLPSTCARCM